MTDVTQASLILVLFHLEFRLTEKKVVPQATALVSISIHIRPLQHFPFTPVPSILLSPVLPSRWPSLISALLALTPPALSERTTFTNPLPLCSVLPTPAPTCYSTYSFQLPPLHSCSPPSLGPLSGCCLKPHPPCMSVIPILLQATQYQELWEGKGKISLGAACCCNRKD